MKRTLSIILTVCMLIGLLGTFALADVTDSVPAFINADGENIFLYNETVNGIPHNGKIVLTGSTDYGIVVNESGTYYIDIYNLTSDRETKHPLIQVVDGSTVYVTFHGINSFRSVFKEFTAYENSHITVDFADNSSATFALNGSDSGLTYADEDSSITFAEGIEVPPADGNGVITISKGTPEAVEFTYEYADDENCTVKAGDKTVGIISHDTIYKSDGAGHSEECANCKHVFSEYSMHDFLYYKIDENSCRQVCAECNAEGETVPHLYTAYDYYDDEHCINYCYYCGYANEESGLVPHDYKVEEIKATDTEAGHTLYNCKNCRGVKKEYKGDNIHLNLWSYGTTWEDSAIIVLKNGLPLTVVSKRSINELEEYEIPYDENASYHFIWVGRNSYQDEFGVDIYFPWDNEPVFSDFDMSGYNELGIIYDYNEADYGEYWNVLEDAPASFEYYTKESVDKLKEAVKKIRWGLTTNQQDDVDNITAQIKEALDGLVPTETPNATGLIDIQNPVYITTLDGVSGYYLDDEFYAYDGEYVIFDPYGYSEEYITVDGVKADVTIVSTWFESGYPISIINGADVTLTTIDTAIVAAYDGSYSPAILVDKTSKLTISDKTEGLIAIGDTDCAGIGGDSSDEYNQAGDITVNGGNIIALSESDGAAIGGGYHGGFGTITVNGGRIFAECMADDGAGIGTGDGGIGGDIIINGGDITALSLDDDGAGIGGGDEGHVDSITINGGKIVAGTDDGASIGGGDSVESFGGKIIINGGILLEYVYDSSSYFIGNDGENVKGEGEDNFVQINGGNIISDGKITPAPKNKDGKALERYSFEVKEELADKDIVIMLSDGTEFKVTAYGKAVSIYIPADVTVTSVADAKHEHLFTNYLYNNDATCCEDGTKTARCDFCSVTDTVKAENTAKGHDDTSKVFADVKEKGWYRKAIDYNYAHNFIVGETKTEFGINNNVTRGMFITILARMAGVDTSKEANKAATTKFTDVKSGKYYSAAIKWAVDNGIVAGTGETIFQPESPIERQQICVMLVNFAKHQNIEIKATEEEIGFADADKISKYAKTAVKTCQTADIVNGYNADGKVEFRAKNTATRAEAAQMLYKFHKDFA